MGSLFWMRIESCHHCITQRLYNKGVGICWLFLEGRELELRLGLLVLLLGLLKLRLGELLLLGELVDRLGLLLRLGLVVLRLGDELRLGEEEVSRGFDQLFLLLEGELDGDVVVVRLGEVL